MSTASGKVLESLARIFSRDIQFAGDRVASRLAASLPRDRLCVADVDAHTELNPPLLRDVGVAFEHGALDLDGTTYRHHHACELQQQPVTGNPNNSAVVFRYLGLDKFALMCLPLGECAFLVSTDTQRD